MLKQMFIVHSINEVSTVVDTDIAYQQRLVDIYQKPDVVNGFSKCHSKPPLEETIQDGIVYIEWKNDGKIPEEYSRYRESPFEMLESYQAMQNRRQGLINIATHPIEMISAYIRPVHSPLYRTGQKEQKSKKGNASSVQVRND